MYPNVFFSNKAVRSGSPSRADTQVKPDHDTENIMNTQTTGTNPVTTPFPTAMLLKEIYQIHNEIFGVNLVSRRTSQLTFLVLNCRIWCKVLQMLFPSIGFETTEFPTGSTVKPVYNDHLMGYSSAFWGSSMWPRANYMSSRRQKLLTRANKPSVIIKTHYWINHGT